MKPTKDPLTTAIIEFHEHILSWEGEVVKKSGLSSTQMHIIEYLADNDAPKMKKIAGRMGITTGSLTVAIDRLEKKGFVKREMMPDDRRSYHIALTDEGKVFSEEHQRFHRELTVDGTVGFTDEERQMFLAFLERFTANL